MPIVYHIPLLTILITILSGILMLLMKNVKLCKDISLITIGISFVLTTLLFLALLNSESPFFNYAFVSIIIGMLVYFFIIRPLMITQNERAEEEYINQLPVWVDIYDLFWEPLMVHILPFILNLAAMAIGFLPGWIGSKAWKSFRNFEARFHYPLESEGLDKKAGKEAVSGVDMFISSSLASSLLQFAGGAVIVTLIVWFINWLN